MDRPMNTPTTTCFIHWTSPDEVDDRHRGYLSDTERQRLVALRRSEDRARFTVAVALLRRTAADHLGIAPHQVPVQRHCPDCERPHGKPVIVGTDLRVSVSHSGRHVVVALCEGADVGIDVERVNPVSSLVRAADRVLSPAELDRLPPPGPDRLAACFTTWSRKESVLKATGDGMRVPMPMLTVSAPDQPARLLDFVGRPELVGRSTIADLSPGPGYVAAVTVLAAGPVAFVQATATANRPLPIAS